METKQQESQRNRGEVDFRAGGRGANPARWISSGANPFAGGVNPFAGGRKLKEG